MKKRVCLIALACLVGFAPLFAGNQPESGLEARTESRQLAPEPAEALQMTPEAAPEAEKLEQVSTLSEDKTETEGVKSMDREQLGTKKSVRNAIKQAKGDSGDILAILGFCFGLAGFLLAFLIFGAGFFFGIAGVILGAIGLKKGTSHRTLGILGIVFGGIAILISVLFFMLLVLLLAA